MEKTVYLDGDCNYIFAGEHLLDVTYIAKYEACSYCEGNEDNKMGIDRIKKNLKLDTNDVVEYCKNKVLNKSCNIYKG